MRLHLRGLVAGSVLLLDFGILFGSVPVEAAPPAKLSRTSLQETNLKCADAGSFRVVYTFGQDTVVLDSSCAMNWYVTTVSLERA